MKRSVVLSLLGTVFAIATTAQNVSVIDLRGTPSTPSSTSDSQKYCAGWNGSTAVSPQLKAPKVRVSFHYNGPPLMRVAEAFDYELEVVNLGPEDLAIPQFADPSQIMNANEALPDYSDVHVGFQLSGPEGSQATFRDEVTLYSSKQQPSTSLILHRGDSVRILGTAKLNPESAPNLVPPKHESFEAKLQAYLQLAHHERRFIENSNCTGWQELSRFPGSLKSENAVAMEIQPE